MPRSGRLPCELLLLPEPLLEPLPDAENPLSLLELTFELRSRFGLFEPLLLDPLNPPDCELLDEPLRDEPRLSDDDESLMPLLRELDDDESLMPSPWLFWRSAMFFLLHHGSLLPAPFLSSPLAGLDLVLTHRRCHLLETASS